MAQTILEYLTQENPPTDRTLCKRGTSTKIHTVYGPHAVRPWTDVTWENLDATFGEVLRKQNGDPRVRDKYDVNRKQRRIYEEESVNVLVQSWNVNVVQHALDGTRETLEANHFEEHLAKGTLHFTKNTGNGHIKDEKGNLQKPDWCIYQEGQEHHDNGRFTYLVPGDSKPAKKWHSDWINCDDKLLKRKADLGIQQLTKYMHLAQTRYGFIITEEELIPLRLSTFDRDSETRNGSMQDVHAQQMFSSTRVSFEEPEGDEYEDGDEAYDRFEQGIGLQQFQELAEFLTEANKKTGYLLEYCRVPWENHGDGVLTINLVLWWLPLLAIQNSSIEETRTYSSLGPSMRQKNQGFTGLQAVKKIDNKGLKMQTSSHRKRQAQSYEQPVARSRPRRASANYGSGKQPPTSQSMSIPSRRSSRVGRDCAVPKAASDLSFPSGNMFNRPPRHRRNKVKGALASSFTSVASSSQAPESFAVSFEGSL
ncbi:unnamed protein product [Periconia digitata]|uniref:Uncharacterized protein n=1 Tax=Periconia digitata TaxID=1303443 RepID=A0A9W4UFV6_9PLEO|nr:unnamed protein product [Periconia digitata]